MRISFWKKGGFFCAAALLLIAMLAGCSGQRAEQYRQQGDTFFRLQNYAEAETAYRNALEADPANMPAKLGLGRCLAAKGNQDEALTMFQEIIMTAPEMDLAYLEAINLLMIRGAKDEALDLASRLESANAERGGVLRASLMLQTEQTASAISLLETLKEKFPNSPVVQAHLANAYLMAGEPSKAENILEDALAAQPAPATGLKMLMAEAMGAQNKISAFLDKQDTQNLQDIDQAMIVAHAFIHGNRETEAEPLIRQVLSNSPSHGWACFVMGSYLVKNGRNKEAVSLLQTAALGLPWEAVVMRDAAASHKEPVVVAAPPPVRETPATPAVPTPAPTPAVTATEDWQTLWRQAALRRLIEERDRFTSTGNDFLRETLVLAAFFRGSGILAEELAQDLPEDSPLHAYLKALRAQEPQEAINALEPWNNQEGMLRLLAMNAVGYAMAISGARGQAVQVFSACAELYPENGVSLLNLAQVFRAANMPKFASRALGRLTAVYPENIEAHILYFNVLRESGMLEEARQAAEIMYALFPQSREASLAICGIYVDSKELALARRVAESFLEMNPGDPEMLLTKASITLREGRPEDALDILTGVSATDNIAIGVTTLTALSHAISKNWAAAIDDIVPNDIGSMALATRFVLAAAYIATGKNNDAIAVMTQEDREQPIGGRASAIILHAIGHTAPQLGDNEIGLAKALAETNTTVDFAAGAAYQVAQLHDDAYLAFKRVDDALTVDNDVLLDFMFLSLPNSVRITNVGEEARALAEKHTTRPRAWLGYALVLQKLGDLSGERLALDQAAAAGADNPQVYLLRGDYFARNKELDDAAEEYRRLLELRPEDPVANNNLAYYLLLKEQDPAQALHHAQLAAKGLPNDPHVLHTLGVALLRTGDLEQSRTNLTMALQLMPGDPALLLDYGQLLIALGDTENGRRHIESALASSRAIGLDFDRQEEAEKILKKTTE